MRSFALIVVEGALEVPASLRLLEAAGAATKDLRPLNKGGRDRFWKAAPRYNCAAGSIGPVLALADLEASPCPSGLMRKHLQAARHPDFILRIAERMLESWFLADPAFAHFLGISPALLPQNPDLEANPKQRLVNLARRAKSRDVRADLVPEDGSLGIVGKGYTARMAEFIEEHWFPSEAQKRSESLRRALNAIRAALTS